MQQSGFKVEIKKYRATAQWRWDIQNHRSREKRALRPDENEEEEDAICGICRQYFDSTCPDCLIPGDDCPPVLGACSHAFHMHCIVKWLEAQNQHHQDERRQQCPMCRADWQFLGSD